MEGNKESKKNLTVVKGIEEPAGKMDTTCRRRWKKHDHWTRDTILVVVKLYRIEEDNRSTKGARI